MKILDLWDFPVTLYCNAHEKMHDHSRIVDPDPGTVSCRFFGPSLHKLLGGWGWGACSAPSTQTYCAMIDGHCMLYLRHNTRPRPRDKKHGWGRGAPLFGVPPQQLHSHHATVHSYQQIHEKLKRTLANLLLLILSQVD